MTYQSMSLMIDEEGREWPWPSHELLRRLPAEGSVDDPAVHAIRQLGFAGVALRHHAALVRFDPRSLSAEAQVALYYLLAETRPRQVALTYADGDWRHEIRQGGAALRRIAQLVEVARAERGARFCSRRRRAAELGVGRFAPLAALLTFWRPGVRADNIDELGARLHAFLGERYLIARDTLGPMGMVYAKIGRGHRDADEMWHRQAIGAPVEYHPDPRFGDWIRRTFEEVADSGKARIDDVDALIHPTGRVPVRVRYRRVIVPFLGSLGEPVIVSASLADPTIDLLVDAGDD
jgi:hypothetical protein